MKLYELSNDFQDLFDKFDEITNFEFDTNADGKPVDSAGNVIENPLGYVQAIEQAWFDTLEGIEGEFDLKAENVAVYIKSLKAESANLKAEEKALKSRRERKDKQIKSLTEYLIRCMDKVDRKKIETAKMVVSIRNNAESLVVDDELAFVKWAQENNDDLLKYSMPEIKRNEVKKLYKTGVQFPHVHLERSRSLIVK